MLIAGKGGDATANAESSTSGPAAASSSDGTGSSTSELGNSSSGPAAASSSSGSAAAAAASSSSGSGAASSSSRPVTLSSSSRPTGIRKRRDSSSRVLEALKDSAKLTATMEAYYNHVRNPANKITPTEFVVPEPAAPTVPSIKPEY